jgi:type II restriction enzyme
LRLEFDPCLAEGYRSGAQRARRLTEGWFAAAMYCVACGETSLGQHPNNAHANDFFCRRCAASFELKSGSKPFRAVVPAGAFGTMIERLERQGGGPHLALLHYCASTLRVRDLVVVPGPLLTRDVIQRRPPLAAHARRAGWVGCNIRIGDLPLAGRIAVVRDGIALPRDQVVSAVQQVSGVRGNLDARTWLVDTLRCVEQLGPVFSLADVYAFEAELRLRHPGNQHIRPKLRQQLQRLRDSGLLAFLGEGQYRRTIG